MKVITRHIDSTGKAIAIGDTIVDETGGAVTVFMENHQARVAVSPIDITNGQTCSLNLWMLMCQSVTVKHS